MALKTKSQGNLMKKLFTLSLALSSALLASEITIEKITVRGESQKALKDALSAEEIKFTNKIDIAQILSNSYPEISTVRKTGAAGDIGLRGFYKDDVRVTVDGQAIHCACPNRMDPPTYHLSAENVEKVELIEGPFDVASPGALSGSINIVSKAPQEGVSGSLNAGYGSFDFQKFDANLNAGNKTIKAQAGYTKEKMGQYKDGSGSEMYKVNFSPTLTNASNNKMYRNDINIEDKDAFDKQSYFAKLSFTPTENQELSVSYFADRPDTILYPSLGMDSFQDDTDMYAASYKIKNLGKFSDSLEVSAYQNEVKHDMRTDFRNTGAAILSYYVESKTTGIKAENTSNIAGHLIKIGADYYERVWDAQNFANYATKTLSSGAAGVPYPLADVTTENYGFYAKLAKSYGDISIDAGIRYDASEMSLDSAKVAAAGATIMNRAAILANPDDKWGNMSGSLMAKYGVGSGYFYAGYGHSVRLPDGAEKYHLAVHGREGNPNLKPTINDEIDAGYSYAKNGAAFKLNAFYSNLKNFIYMYKYNAMYFTYENIDAKMYGWDASTAYAFANGLSLEGALAQTFGTKDSVRTTKGVALNDTSLRNMPPLKARVAAKYETGKLSAQAEWIAASGQKNIDTDGTLPELSTAGWAVVNLKAGYAFNKNWSLWAGVDNLFDKNYYIHGSNSNMLFISNQPNIHLNEPGRFVYANLGYKF